MKYPNTYYSDTAIASVSRSQLTADMSVDVCIVGAGISGLSCALALLKEGKSVAIIERESVAWGASGRNGGLVSPGWAQGLDALEEKLGLKKAQDLYALSVQGVQMIRRNIAQYDLQHCAVKVGELQAARYPQKQKLLAKQQSMADKYHAKLDFLETDEVRNICRTQRYFQGLYSDSAFHFHPLNYCLSLAAIIEQQGGQIYEHSDVLNVDSDGVRQRVKTAQGVVVCDQVVFCTGGYTTRQVPGLYRSVLPIATYMVLTEPLGDLAEQLISQPYSIKDDRRAADYYRLVEGDRLLWGSRITTKNPTDQGLLAKLLREDLCSVYPELAAVKIDKSWSGLMAYARHKMPIVQEHKKGQWLCSAFGGHGLNTGSVCGALVAQAICDSSDDYRQLAPFGCEYNGGILGPVAANLTYNYLRLRDKIQEANV